MTIVNLLLLFPKVLCSVNAEVQVRDGYEHGLQRSCWDVMHQLQWSAFVSLLVTLRPLH